MYWLEWQRNHWNAISEEEDEEFQPELKIANKETQSVMNIVCNYVESGIDIAHETFKVTPHLETAIELQRDKNTQKTALDNFFKCM